MPVAKLKASNTTDVMKSEEANDSLDTLIRQAIGKEPFFSFSRAGDSPVQWIQLLHALDQPDLPGWPLLTPLKVQMQKCDKCSREFCSPINHRRHIRVHHRLKKLDKDSTKNRDLVAAFWDKLSEDEAMEIVSFEDVSLEEVPGSSVVKALTALTRKPGYSSVAMPQVCLRAGSVLLDIIQSRPSRFPISSHELFSILDDASEKTFLCGPAVSMQKYIFDGDVGKIGLETKNVVACTSFLVEQKLIKAWLADKDAEALRCQKLLVEEEEAAQRRQAELLERRRQKKLRQKEQRAKEQRHGEKADVKESMSDTLEAVSPAETASTLAASDSDVHNPDDHVPASLEPFRFSNIDDDADFKIQTGSGVEYPDSGTGLNVERRVVQGSNRRLVARWHVPPKSQRGVPNGFHASQNSQVLKLGAMQKHGINRDSRAAPIVNGNKVWSRKPKLEKDEETLKNRIQKEAINQPDKNHEVLIGSISVTLGNSSQRDGSNLAGAQEDCLAEHRIPKNSVQEKPNKPDSVQGGANRSMVKLWRPVSRHGAKGTMPVQNGGRELEVDVTVEKGGDQTLSSESCLRSCASSLLEENVFPACLQFDRHTAEAFLGLRWKEAIAADHVKLVLSPDSEPLGCPNDCQVAVSQSADLHRRSILGNAENRLVNAEAHESSTAGVSKAKFRTKPEKGAKIKYIAKQRTIT